MVKRWFVVVMMLFGFLGLDFRVSMFKYVWVWYLFVEFGVVNFGVVVGFFLWECRVFVDDVEFFIKNGICVFVMFSVYVW